MWHERSDSENRGEGPMWLLVLLALAFILYCGIAKAHSWYPVKCCSNQDCHPVACEDISETKDGYEWNGNKFDKIHMQPSEDAHCHVCISPYAGPLCIFIVQGS